MVVILYPNNFLFNDIHFLGIILGTLSAIFYALEILMKKILVKSYEADIIVVWYLMISVILLSPFISYKNIINIGTFGLISLAGLGIIVVAAGITLFTSGLRDVKAHHAGIISYIEPLGAILWGALIIKEIPSMLTIGGGSLILLSTYVLIKNRDK